MLQRKKEQAQGDCAFRQDTRAAPENELGVGLPGELLETDLAKSDVLSEDDWCLAECSTETQAPGREFSRRVLWA